MLQRMAITPPSPRPDRIRRLVAVTLVIGLALAGTALGATGRQATTKARKAANHYTNGHYSIGFAGADGWRMWSARCRASGAGWRCSVRMSGGQCAGTLKLTRTLTPFAHRIACGE